MSSLQFRRRSERRNIPVSTQPYSILRSLRPRIRPSYGRSVHFLGVETKLAARDSSEPTRRPVQHRAPNEKLTVAQLVSTLLAVEVLKTAVF